MLNPSGEVTLTGVAGRGPCYGFAASAADLESSAAGFPSSPRRFSNGSMEGSRPTKFLNKPNASAEQPRLSNVCRNRSPYSRLNPPCSLTHSTMSASSTSLQTYEHYPAEY